MRQDAALRALHTAGEGVDDALKKMLAQRRTSASARMYDMLGYFFGFLDTDLKKSKGQAIGKRFRPALCLLIAEGYGAREKARDAALAIELFHNFTLIHDDIEDHDEYRRGRSTLWKLFGVEHAINAGDALSLIACETAANTEPAVRNALMAAFSEVIEGQYMDFVLASEPIGSGAVSIETYMMATEKKTGALFGVAAEAAGMCAGQSAEECARLREYGRSLGNAFQLTDDYASVWSAQAETGKDAQSDIRERKRTLPFFVAYKETSSKQRLVELYEMDRQLSNAEIAEVRTIIDATPARSHVLQQIQAHAKSARAAAKDLSLRKETQALLVDLVEALIPLEKRSASRQNTQNR